MKTLRNKIGITLTALLLSTNLVAALIQFDFTSATIGGSTTYSSSGDVLTATNVATVGVTALDATLTITETSFGTPSGGSPNVFFDLNPARGKAGRVRVDTGIGGTESLPSWAKITVEFFVAGTGTATEFTGFNVGDFTIAQFTDLDSDFGNNYTDFAGFKDTSYDTRFLGSPTNLEFKDDKTGLTDYDIAELQQISGSWSARVNESNTDAASQAPYTARFDTNLSAGSNTLEFIVGTDGSGTPNRHIDFDLSAETIVVPEPGTLVLAGILIGSFGGLHLVRRRKNR